jgi:sugar phosphate permease
MLPALRSAYGLSLGEAGLLLAAVSGGAVISLLPWGFAADRFGERWVVVIGLLSAALCLFLAGRTHSSGPLIVLLGLVGLLGAGVNAASGRAVMQWFQRQERGLALGIRQAAIPIGGAAASLSLPQVVDAGGTRWGLYALALGCVCGALAAGVVLREGPGDGEEGPALDARPLRDSRIWRLLAASVLLLFPQMAVFGYMVLFLHDRRGLSPAQAAAALAVVQVLGIGSRIGTGRWSDVWGSRMRPLRLLAICSGTLAVAIGLCADAPLALLLPVLVVGGVVSMSWNGLSFAAAAEIAGSRRSGSALGLQQTALALGAAGLAPLFAAIVGALGWGWAWGLAAVGPALAFVVLRRLDA